MKMTDEEKEKMKKYMEGQGIHNLDQAWALVREHLLAFETALAAINELYPEGSEKDSILWAAVKRSLGIVIMETWKRQVDEGT